jgi:UDP-N-acetylmuramyl pentapeptide synthase
MQASSLLAPVLAADDVVLLKASRAEGLERMLPRLRSRAKTLLTQETEG